MTTQLRLLFTVLLLALGPAVVAADEPATKQEAVPVSGSTEAKRVIPDAPPAAPNPTAVPANPADDVVTLPAVQVTRSRIRQIDVTIKRIDKLIARERKHLKTSDTDLALNNDKVANKAALFGGYSTSQRIAVASERVRLLESERELLEQMKAPMTKDDFAVVEKQVELLRTTRRELDIVYR